MSSIFDQIIPLRADLVKPRIKEMVLSKEYWVFVIDPSSALLWKSIICGIEERYYSGDKNDDFNFLLIQGDGVYFNGWVPMIFAKKEHMSEDELRKVLPPKIRAEVESGKDMMILGGPKDSHEYSNRVKCSIYGWFESFVYPKKETDEKGV